MKKKEPVLSVEVEGRIGPALLELRALGDALVCVGIAKDEVSLLDGTLQSLAYLMLDRVQMVGKALGFMRT